jgi:glycosyltransferase involved in cell wall biosynthesis
MKFTDFDLLFSHSSSKVAPVTVFVSSYNYAHFVLETLESVKNQDYENLSLTVVDDCSSDQSCDVIIKWLEVNKDRFQEAFLLRHKENAGLARTRNTGFANSKSNFIFVLDSDNLLLRKCIRRCAETLERTDAAFVYPILAKFGNYFGLASNNHWHEQDLLWTNYIDASALIRKNIWEEVGGYEEEALLDDYELWLKILAAGKKGIQVPEILLKYRVHNTSLSHSFDSILKGIYLENLRKKYPNLAWPQNREYGNVSKFVCQWKGIPLVKHLRKYPHIMRFIEKFLRK